LVNRFNSQGRARSKESSPCKREGDKKELEESVLFNIKTLVEPHLERLKAGDLTSRQRAHLEMLESKLGEIISPFAYRLPHLFKRLTPVEIHVADLVKRGKSTKEIAQLIQVSDQTVSVHRRSIRKKLGLDHRKTNLRIHLLSIPE
jgi:DNA-binding NarL/FixJ family response regulator